MTSIHDIPYKDIEEFLLANNTYFNNKDDAYDKSLILLKDKNTKGHTISIIEWLISHNLLIRNINIRNYTTNEIDNMSQNEINNLSKLLTMKGNNRENIKNILNYLYKLDNISLLPEINNIILKILDEIEINDINFEILDPYDIITLLKVHRNKSIIRKEIYNNMKNILFYNFVFEYGIG